MYYYRTRAYIMYEKKELEDALLWLEKAIDITMPGWMSESIDNYYISTYEMENLLLYAIILYKMKKIDEANEHVWMCEAYIRRHFSDMEEYSKIYPKCVWTFTYVNKNLGDKNIISLCDDALMLLRKNAISYFLVPIMGEMISRLNFIGETTKAEYWQVYYDILVKMYEKYAPDMSLDYLFFNPYQCEYHLDYELIKGERVAKGYTQESLIEGIYESPEPLSRIENGRTIPRKKKLEAIMKKLDIEKGRYNSFLVTDSFENLEKKSEIEHCLSIYDMKNAKIKIKDLENSLEMAEPDNRRYIENVKNTVERLLGEKNNTEALGTILELLNETYNIENANRSPMRNEALLIVQLGSIMKLNNKYEDAIRMFEKVLKCYDKSRMDSIFRSKSYMTIYASYAQYLGESRFSKESIYASDIGVILQLKAGKLASLPRYYLYIACNKMELGCENIQCKELLKESYTLNNLVFNKDNAQLIKEFYEKEYGEVLE